MRCQQFALAIALVALTAGSAAGSEPTLSEPVAPEPTQVEPVAVPLDPATGEPIAATEMDDGAAGLFVEMSPEEIAEYAAALREVVGQVRGRVMEKINARIEAKQSKRMDRVAGVLFALSLGGFLLLLAPLVLRKKYPGKTGVLFRYSALAAVMFFVAVNLFAAVLMIMRGAQAETGRITNPQVRLVNATFDLLVEKADEIAPVGPAVIEPTLLSLTGETDQPVLTTMLDNVQRLKEDFTVFASVGRFFSRLDFLFGLLPIVLVGLAAFLFAKATKPTLTEIVELPARAAEGERGVGREVARRTVRSVWQEFKATLCVIGVLVAVTFGGGMILGYVLIPAVEVFLAYLVVALAYVQVEVNASSFWVIFCLMGTIVFLVLNLLVVLLSSAFFLGKTQKIFQRRFREQVPLRSHARFWKWGIASLLWAQLLPLAYITASLPAVGWLAERTAGEGQWRLTLGLGPALFVLGFCFTFWLARGGRAIAFLKKYDPSAVAVEQPAAAVDEEAMTVPIPRVAVSAVTSPSGAHPDENLLVGLMLGTLPPDQTAAVSAHVQRCRHCWAVFAACRARTTDALATTRPDHRR